MPTDISTPAASVPTTALLPLVQQDSWLAPYEPNSWHVSSG
ncbi:hypothetical protein [Hymenobacter sp. AT01-02]|nr:hypothetical protein [Hymenobacter sp. AT01-02]